MQGTIVVGEQHLKLMLKGSVALWGLGAWPETESSSHAVHHRRSEGRHHQKLMLPEEDEQYESEEDQLY